MYDLREETGGRGCFEGGEDGGWGEGGGELGGYWAQGYQGCWVGWEGDAG